MRFPRSDKSSAGFTLIELAVVIIIASVTAALGAGILIEGGRVYARVKSLSAAYADARYALNRLEMDLSGLADRSQITEMGAHSITITLISSSVRYLFNGSALLRDNKTLAGRVAQFNLTYYKSDGGLAATPSDIQRIAAEIEVRDGRETASLRTEVFPRTFRDVPVPPGGDPEDYGVNGRGGRRWWWFGRLFRWTRHRIW